MIANNSELKKRLHKTLIKYTVVLCVALAYLIFVQYTNMGIPCLFYELTGLKCPGCGITRMFVALAELDVAAAFKHNSFLLVTGPLILGYLIWCEVKYVRYGNRRMGKWEILMWAELVLAIAYGVLRNIFPI